jgi:hypothetical protein
VEDAVSFVSPTPEAVNVGFVVALEVKVNVELWAPLIDGANVTATVWVPPGESVNEVGVAAKELLLLARLVTVRVILPEFVTLSVWEFEPPMMTVPRETDEDPNVIAAPPVLVPAPDKLTCEGLPLALCVTERVALYVCTAEGENVTVTVWAPPPEAMLKLVGLTANAALLLAMFETLSVAVPVLLTVNVFWALLPVFTFPNVSVDAETEISGTGPDTPVPVTLKVVGLPEALWLMVIVPEYEVTEVGVKVRVTVCLPPAGTEKLVGLIVKALLLLEMLETLNDAVPVLEMSSDCWLLVLTLTLPNDSEEEESEITGAVPESVERSDIP